MKTITKLGLLFFTAILLFTSCSNVEEDNPEVVTVNFMEALLQYDINKIKKYCTEESGKRWESIITKLTEKSPDKVNKAKEKNKRNSRVEILESALIEDGNTCIVRCKTIQEFDEEDEKTLKLVKENEKWKVAS